MKGACTGSWSRSYGMQSSHLTATRSRTTILKYANMGNLWRRGPVPRVPATDPGRKPRWKYLWKKKKVPTALGAIDYVPKPLVERDNMVISEEGDQIQIDLKDIVIIIKVRKPTKS